MLKRILLLTVVVAILVAPPVLVSLLVSGRPNLSWVPTFAVSIAGWTAFLATVAKFSGYTLRDLVDGRWLARLTSNRQNTRRMAMRSRSLIADRPEDDSDLKELKKSLKQKQELLEAIDRRIHALKVKKASFGSAFSAGEDAELRQAEEEAQDLKDEIHRLEAKIGGEGN